MNRLNDEIEVRAQILAAPAYQERCEGLFEIFKALRQWDGNAQTLLGLQAALGEILIEWQERKTEFKKNKDHVRFVLVKRLILILKKIADALVWRAFRYDRVLIQLLSEHPQTGHLDESIKSDFEIAHQILSNSGDMVLINDLTSTLLHGDLTVIRSNGLIEIIENKSGRSSSRNTRAIRQKRQLADLKKFLNTGFRISKDNTRDHILRTDVKINTYHNSISQVIKLAKRKGYHREILSECFAIEAIWMNHQNATLPLERPFNEIEHILPQNNLDVFDETTRRIVPYSVFPSSSEKIEEFLSFSKGERMRNIKQDRSSWFAIRNGSDLMKISPDYWGRVVLEFIDENSILQAQIDNLT
ncbi:hypothetical protein [Candidatus Leptofilum sp.]|uniref:hypothetical protein n=1 Tax=Candidatus Leptofilum sp. TaxID=3241576 RepID=UPI003B5C557B